MAVSYTDDQIDARIEERKLLPADWQSRRRMKAKHSYDEVHVNFRGEAGTGIRLVSGRAGSTGWTSRPSSRCSFSSRRGYSAGTVQR